MLTPKQEIKLQRQGGRLRDKSSSTIDDFAARGPGAAYSDMAAAAMDRVRARLMGYEDDRAVGLEEASAPSTSAAAGSSDDANAAGPGPSAAQRVLHAMMHQCVCREERAEAIAEACVPPGLMVAAQHRHPSERQLAPATVRVCTTPDGLLAAIAAERSRLTGGPQQAAAADEQPPLPSGEPPLQVLHELQEDVSGYDAAVYSRLSPLERFGAGTF